MGYPWVNMAFSGGSIQMNIQVNKFGKRMTTQRCSGLLRYHSPSFLIHLLKCNFQLYFKIVPAIVMEQKALYALLRTALQEDWHRFRITRCSFDKESSLQKQFSVHCAKLLTFCRCNPFNVVVLWILCKGFASHQSRWEYWERPKIKSLKALLVLEGFVMVSQHLWISEHEFVKNKKSKKA